MSCPSRRPGRQLTDNQAGQLRGLHTAGAVDRDTSVPIHRADILVGVRVYPGNTVVMGGLVERGLVRKRRVPVAGGSTRAEYWLTDEGVATALRLKAAAY